MNKFEFQMLGNPLSLILQLKPFHDAYLIKTNAINMFHQITEATGIVHKYFPLQSIKRYFSRIMHLTAVICRPLLLFFI